MSFSAAARTMAVRRAAGSGLSKLSRGADVQAVNTSAASAAVTGRVVKGDRTPGILPPEPPFTARPRPTTDSTASTAAAHA